MLLPALIVSLQPVAVMVHGAGSGGWEYELWRPVFEKAGYRVIAKDLVPGAGGLGKTKFSDYVSQVEGWQRSPDLLIGASMGGVIVLKAAEKLNPKRIVLVCSAVPAGILPVPKVEPYPPIIHWKDGPYEDTVASMPDSDEATRQWAWPRWRDESGVVLTELRKGVKVSRPKAPVLCVIPLADDTVLPSDQMKLAKWSRATVLQYEGMSHVGPLLSTQARSVAAQVINWARP